MSRATATRSSEPAVTARRWPEFRGDRLRGSMNRVRREPLALYDEAWREHGDYVRLRALPGIYFYLLADPAAIEHVLQSRHKNYRKPDVLTRSFSVLAGNGIFTSEGDFWRRQRRLMQPAFFRQSVAKFGPQMTAAIDALMRRWEEREAHQPLDIVPEMMGLALRIASTALFTSDISGQADEIGRAYRTAFEYVSLKMNSVLMPPLWVPTRRNREFRRSKALLDRVVLELIAGRRHQPAQGDVLDLLLAAQDEESGSGMSDDQLKDEVITLLTAGHETTGAALSWAWYLLATHPEWQRALHQQVHSHLQGRLPTVADLPNLPLATAVFEETMRLYPPAWSLPREAIEPDEINGYPVPAGALFVLAMNIVHRHPDFWPQPDTFDPRRFLPGNQAQRPKFAYFPFGGGPRMCIGLSLAMLEGPLALAALAQRFHFSLVPNQTVVADATFTLRPKDPVMFTLRKHA